MPLGVFGGVLLFGGFLFLIVKVILVDESEFKKGNICKGNSGNR